MINYKEFLERMEFETKKKHVIEAVNLTMKDLAEYNVIVPNDGEYYKGLEQLLYYIMFYPITSKKAIINFPTGCGKSTAMNAGISYMLRNKILQPYAGTIILKLTKADCNETVREINKKAKLDLAYAYHSGFDKLNNRKRSSISNDELKEYPVIVLTHSGYLQLIDKDDINKLCEWSDKRINTKHGKYNTYYRERLIVDEAINNVQFMTVTMKSISDMENYIMNLGNEDIYDRFNGFVTKIKKEFLRPYDIKKNSVFFCEFDSIEVPEGLDELFYSCKDKQAKDSYMAIRTMLETGGYVNIHDDIKYKSIITYKYIDMNNPYFHKVTLDATSGINYLYEIDSDSEVRDLPQIKSYKNVHLNIFNGVTGSSASMRKGLEDGLLDAIIEDIKSKIVGDEKVLIVTNSEERDKMIMDALKGYEKLEQIDVTHYGRTIGSNKWSDFSKIFILGIQLLADEIYPLLYFTSLVKEDELTAEKFNSLDTTLVPIKGNRKYKQKEFERVKVSVISSLIVQTLNRVKCRGYEDSKAPETYGYLINRDKEIDTLIAKAMPDIQITYNWGIEYKSKKSGKQVENKKDVVETLIEFFEKVRLDKGCRVELFVNGVLLDQGLSKAKIREMFDIKSITFKKAMTKPIMLQYIKDNNIDIESNNRYIKIF
jgi:hypothetical protein